METHVTSPVLEMLKEDHQKVKHLVEEFKQAGEERKGEIAKTVIHELEIHAALEEGLIYPAIRDAIGGGDIMNAAVEEHHLMHVSIAELKKLKSGDKRFEAKFNVLGELVKLHVQEEEGDMFPKAEASDVNWEELEADVLKRKQQLLTKGTGRAKSSRSGSRGKKTS